ncbi:dnaJ homolog subfamily C member 2 [Contarinia nasturtii]|uniref:dnaJ homolog subfamily C member 2 n=1 Tax=Contarinia nasturtii TaxID=265458 RepID=UPI0012D40BD8|nr:dnaJ homolog subfamily C member 2 [Contarinia nasturtii]
MSAENSKYTVAICQPLVQQRVQCVGPHFMKYLHKIRHGGDGVLSSASSIDEISANETEFEIDVDYLRSLDPKEWKDQDHYHVLGLKTLRYNATDDDIKRAYRKIVLKHHPDKRKAQGENVHTDSDYFTCITKAYETLGNPTKRRSYDSVDPIFDDSLPTQSEINKNFYETFSKYFGLNARWSEKKRVPEIGGEDANREHVENFYNFWYSFESWREYSYLDEEDKDKGQDRDERRWIDKQNKAVRIKRKKEEMSRIRALVDLAYNNDPRIVRIKNEEKEKKQAAKRARMSAVQAQRAEEERVLKEAQLAKERAEQAEQKRIEQIRLEKEQQKRALKKERKILRDMAKENNYYSTSDKERIKNMEGVEKICEMLKYLDLQSFNKDLSNGGRNCFIKMLKQTEDKLEEERQAVFGASKTVAAAQQAQQAKQNTAVKSVDKNAMWCPENMQVLIKAVNLFPAGTVQRWEVIANYLNQHCTNLSNRKFAARDVLNKAKDLQSSDFAHNSLKVQANQNAFESFEKTKKELKIVDNAEISVNNDGETNASKKNKKTEINGTTSKKPAAEAVKTNGHTEKNEKNEKSTPTNTNDTATAPSQVAAGPWSKDEQALLEQAMKTYPVSTPDRWDRIAECIPNRSKKDCLRRVKELVDLVNAKREAQQTAK